MHLKHKRELSGPLQSYIFVLSCGEERAAKGLSAEMRVADSKEALEGAEEHPVLVQDFYAHEVLLALVDDLYLLRKCEMPFAESDEHLIIYVFFSCTKKAH